MRFRLIKEKGGGQRGLGVLEIAVSLVITGLIGLGVASATAQVLNQTSRNGNYTAGVTQVLNAIHWISRDTQMAQTVAPDAGGTGFPLQLDWVEWDNTSHTVTYTASGDTIIRSHSINSISQGSTAIARYINWAGANTTIAQNSDNVVEMRITATVGGGGRAVSITKVRNVIPRPGL